MTSRIYMQHGRELNPGRALYKYWHSILYPQFIYEADGYPNQFIYFGGKRSYGIGVRNRHSHLMFHDARDEEEYGTNRYPTLGFGYGWGSYTLNPLFLLNRKGEFKLYKPHGDMQRNMISEQTFLDWKYEYSAFQWFVDTDMGHTTSTSLTNWRSPRHYVSQGLFARTDYYFSPPWMKVVRGSDGRWQIAFSRPSSEKRMADNPDVRTAYQEDFDKYEELRIKRYLRLERASRIASGELIAKKRRLIPTEEMNKRLARDVNMLSAHLVVQKPATTTPLKRTLEGV